MEDIRQSVSRMFNRMRKPSMKSSKVANSPIKAGKVFSSPNLLQLPSGQLQQSAATQKRSKSTSYIAEKEHGRLEKVSSSKCIENIESKMQNTNTKNHKFDMKGDAIYQNEVFSDDKHPKIITGQQKKSPPKRPPPPKVLPEKYQNNVYANLQRRKSDSEIGGTRHVYANLDDGKIDTCESKTAEDLNLYINQAIQTTDLENVIDCNQYEEIMTVSLGETYISMSGNDEDVDENGYVTMSRERSMTS